MILTPVININNVAIVIITAITIRLSILYIYVRGIKEYIVTLGIVHTIQLYQLLLSYRLVASSLKTPV